MVQQTVDTRASPVPTLALVSVGDVVRDRGWSIVTLEIELLTRTP
ncbi:hypothetical protein [Natrinema gelatinilyticum]|nr:hypothetical protein [Natrinema gelatinilyticum]